MARQDPTSAFLNAIRNAEPRAAMALCAPTKVSVEVDADIWAHFGGDTDAVTRINRVLRAHIEATRG